MKRFVICAALALISHCVFADSWTTLSFIPNGTDGSNVVGSNKVYNISTGSTTTLNSPYGPSTSASDIEGSTIIGGYTDSVDRDHGLIYNGTSWTPLDYGDSANTVPHGIDGGIIVGNHTASSGYEHAFKYDNGTWTDLVYPGAIYTMARGISGNKIVGMYQDSSFTQYGFLYDGTTWTTLDHGGGTMAYGISGNTIVGVYQYTRSFMLNGTTWTDLKYPGSNYTQVFGISGNYIVGQYADNSLNMHGFLYTIPEPCTLLLLGLGGALLRKKKVSAATRASF